MNEITTNPEAYARYLELQGDNPLSSAGNVALVMIQKPEATLFGTRDRWRSLGRFVSDGEQDLGAKIFTRSPTGRGYILSDAYDLAQTQGREISPPQPLQDNTREMEMALTVLLRFSPVPVTANREMTAAALYDPRTKQLSINPSYSDSEAFAAIATEIAHARFHDKGFNQTYSREGYDLSAQSVSCILCRRFGINREPPDLSALPTLYQGWQTQNRQKVLSILFIRGAKPVMDLKYDLTKHPAIRHTIDGGGPPYIHHQKKPQIWLSGKPLFVLGAENFYENKENADYEKPEESQENPDPSADEA